MTLREGAEFANNLKSLLSRFRFTFANEKQLQDQLQSVFQEAKLDCLREYTLYETPSKVIGVVDFCFRRGVGPLQNDIAVEVKVGGPLNQHLRQLKRYADQTHIAAVVLIATRPFSVPPTLSNKPCFCINIGGNRL